MSRARERDKRAERLLWLQEQQGWANSLEFFKAALRQECKLSEADPIYAEARSADVVVFRVRRGNLGLDINVRRSDAQQHVDYNTYFWRHARVAAHKFEEATRGSE